MLSPTLQEQKAKAKNQLRSLFFGVFPAIAWVGMVSFAIALFAPTTLSRRAIWGHQTELLGFAVAFTVGGTISGSAAMATYANRARAFWFGFPVCILLTASCFWVWMKLGSPPTPNNWMRGRAISSMKTGAVPGLLLGLIIAAGVVALGVLTRRRLTWQLGIATVVVLAVSIVWVIPRVIAWETAIAFDLHVRYYWYEPGTIFGASAGAASGSIVGAVVTALVAQLGRNKSDDSVSA